MPTHGPDAAICQMTEKLADARVQNLEKGTLTSDGRCRPMGMLRNKDSTRYPCRNSVFGDRTLCAFDKGHLRDLPWTYLCIANVTNHALRFVRALIKRRKKFGIMTSIPNRLRHHTRRFRRETRTSCGSTPFMARNKKKTRALYRMSLITSCSQWDCE